MGRARGNQHSSAPQGFAAVLGTRRGSGRDVLASRDSELLRARLAQLDVALRDGDLDAAAATAGPDTLDAGRAQRLRALIEQSAGSLEDSGAARLAALARFDGNLLAGPLLSPVVERLADGVHPDGDHELAEEVQRVLMEPGNDSWSGPLRLRLAARMTAGECRAGDETVQFTELLVARPELTDLAHAVAAGFRYDIERYGDDADRSGIAMAVCRNVIDRVDADGVEQLGPLADAFCDGMRGGWFMHPVHPMQSLYGHFSERPDIDGHGPVTAQLLQAAIEVAERPAPERDTAGVKLLRQLFDRCDAGGDGYAELLRVLDERDIR